MTADLAAGAAALVVRDLSKTFERGGRTVTAIETFSIDVADGEFVSIVGPSGCGKSTFLHIVGGFERPSGGTMRLYGAAVDAPGADRGIMFQDSSLFPWLTVGRNVAWPLEIAGASAERRRDVIEANLEMVGLAGFRDHYPAELSGGMKQRAALARLLALDPKIMLMDEPFGALDAQTRENMQEQLQSIWSRHKKTVLFITHDIDEAIYLGTRVIVFTARPGRIKADIPVELPFPRPLEIKKSPAYVEYRNEIWDLLREEVKRAAAEQEAAGRP
jgi:NitT/TauT family transport system ATP-binding protein